MKEPGFLTTLGLLVSFAHPCSLSHASPPPNIIVMMADDMGFSDIGCYGGEIETPNLDRLAAGGLRFTQFYNTARCCSTRASLMTGLYPHQAGVGHMMDDRGQDGYRGNLNRHSVTIAEVLKSAGYATSMAGKWHVTKEIAPEGPKDNWPRQRGFERFFGTIHGAGSFYDPNTLSIDNTQTPAPQVADDFYYTEQISEFAARFIADHDEENDAQPFFMYVAYTSPHWPMHARPRDIEKYRGRYDAGWETLRKERHARMVELGIVDGAWPISPPTAGITPWAEAADKAWEARLMEVYAAMVDNMDQGIGRILEALEKAGELENTLILFLADNGGCAENMGRQGAFQPRENLGAMSAGQLQPDMIPEKSRDGWKVRKGRGVMAGPADTYLGYGEAWANASNTPYRYYKHFVHEGGISSPLIAHWPDGIPRRGELEHTPGHLIDIMATCVELAGAQYPATFHQGDQEIHPMEGISLAPAFTGEGETIHKKRAAIFWEHEGNRAIRVGDLKLVAKGIKGPWELYDLATDRTEQNDLSASRPEEAA
ncbi:MAG: arylsulfatase, partial [Verrucomicrobiales bacterium]